MNVRTCTSIISRIFIVYYSVGYLCPDFAPIYHDLGGCPDFYFSSLKTLHCTFSSIKYIFLS